MKWIKCPNKMTTREIKLIKAKDAPRRVTDPSDQDIIRHARTILAKVYAKYGIDYREALRRESV